MCRYLFIFSELKQCVGLTRLIGLLYWVGSPEHYSPSLTDCVSLLMERRKEIYETTKSKLDTSLPHTSHLPTHWRLDWPQYLHICHNYQSETTPFLSSGRQICISHNSCFHLKHSALNCLTCYFFTFF